MTSVDAQREAALSQLYADFAAEHLKPRSGTARTPSGSCEGVWTVVNGDPVAMRRGDFLLTPGWNFHGHHNETDRPMGWIDGLDIPFVQYTDSAFFEFGTEQVTDPATPHVPHRISSTPWWRTSPACGTARARAPRCCSTRTTATPSTGSTSTV
jgi:hypothetical protein